MVALIRPIDYHTHELARIIDRQPALYGVRHTFTLYELEVLSVLGSNSLPLLRISQVGELSSCGGTGVTFRKRDPFAYGNMLEVIALLPQSGEVPIRTQEGILGEIAFGSK